MIITEQQMHDINMIQKEIFKSFINVCDQLRLKYYLVHGSLLGAVRCGGFFPFDDDIDVAMPRKDYDVFFSMGHALLRKGLFAQSVQSEPSYPLVFGKIRDSNTAFIQPVLKRVNVNKGIYIDVFPLDNYPSDSYSQRLHQLDYVFTHQSSDGITGITKWAITKVKRRILGSYTIKKTGSK